MFAEQPEIDFLSEEMIENAREVLFFLGNGKKIIKQQKEREFLRKISDHIFDLTSNGHSFSTIAFALQRCGIKIAEDTIREFCSHAQETRLRACEREIISHMKLEWNDLAERITVIENGLRETIRTGEGLVLHYQPQVDMNTGVVHGAEALVRWNFNGELVHPAEFIPIAEKSGLIVQIGDWVLREACREAKRWDLMGLGGADGIKMGVNLSVKQFSQSLPSTIREILQDTGLPTHLLGLEITESLLVGTDSLDMLHSLRSSGIHLSIDDFGTGYSCLANLKDLPLDTIKIDRSFVQNLEVDYKSRLVTEVIISLAEKLGASTLTEGVETKIQEGILRELGCTVCQGFLYAKPMPSIEFIKFVSEKVQ